MGCGLFSALQLPAAVYGSWYIPSQAWSSQCWAMAHCSKSTWHRQPIQGAMQRGLILIGQKGGCHLTFITQYQFVIYFLYNWLQVWYSFIRNITTSSLSRINPFYVGIHTTAHTFPQFLQWCLLLVHENLS